MKVLAYVDGVKAEITEQAAKSLTHMNLAFGHMRVTGELEAGHLQLPARFEQIRAWNPGVKILLSIVPFDPNAFTVCAADPALRVKFAGSCVETIAQYGFDGVDFDWEFPCMPSNGHDCSPADKRNFTLLCEDVRKAIGPNKLLTIAAGADLYYVDAVEPEELARILDFVCVMTYDLKCGFHALAGHHTQLYSSMGDVFRNSCDQALRLFHSRGIPKEKLLMGAAFYSRKWENIKDRNHGLLQISEKGGGYGPNYGLLAEQYINKNGFVRYWDDEAKAPYLFDGSIFLSYDDELSLKYKCEYIKEHGYGGIFYWEHSCDPSGALLAAIADNAR
ncbi:MAG: chitinase [Clostridiales bacterium]|jgi:chitinase|nr:chitinase [Clostridiales bacterium]